MKILVTGAAGFIGFNLSKHLLENNKKILIIGIDSFENYYSIKYKKNRVDILKKYSNFKFLKLNLANKKKLNLFLKKNNFKYIIHLAAQAGVRYSVLKPSKYMENNSIAFFNLLDFYKKFNKKPKKIIYASSSSVYGDSKKLPIKENFKLNPVNFYGLTKKNNEEMADIFSKLYKIKFVGLRFFTVFGEWGRPDMLVLKLLISKLNNKKIHLYNFGNHSRDFTYIGDVVKILEKLIFKKEKNMHEIYNICSGKKIPLMEVIKILSNLSKFKNFLKKPKSNLEILDTHGSNNKVLKKTKFKNFTPIKKALENTYQWFDKFRYKKNLK